MNKVNYELHVSSASVFCTRDRVRTLKIALGYFPRLSGFAVIDRQSLGNYGVVVALGLLLLDDATVVAVCDLETDLQPL